MNWTETHIAMLETSIKWSKRGIRVFWGLGLLGLTFIAFDIYQACKNHAFDVGFGIGMGAGFINMIWILGTLFEMTFELRHEKSRLAGLEEMQNRQEYQDSIKRFEDMAKAYADARNDLLATHNAQSAVKCDNSGAQNCS